MRKPRKQPDSGVAGTETANTPEGEILFALKLGGTLTRADLIVRTEVSGEVLSVELARLESEGGVEDGATPDGQLRYRLTEAGSRNAAALLDAEREVLSGTIGALLDEFDAANRAFKELLHRWQMRQQGSAFVVNDHSDPGYDDRVLSELGGLVDRAGGWLGRLPQGRARYARYGRRLRRAVGRAGRGEIDFVAGLGVDSAHSVWWQLHADLLAVAGRERGESEA